MLQDAFRRGARLAAALLLGGVSACGDGGGQPARSAAVVDTLPGGAVRVRNPEAGRWDSASAWRAVEAARIGSAEGDDPAALFGDVVDVAVDPLGRVWVLERQAKEVRVFDREGRHVRTVGREGSGPGELRNPIALAWGPGGGPWVVDVANARYTVLDTAGAVVRTLRRDAAGWGLPWGGGFDRAGRLYETSFVGTPDGGSRRAYVRHTVGEALVPTDSFPLPDFREATYTVEHERGGAMRAVPFSPRLSWRFDGEDGIWAGTGEGYRLVRRSLAGDTVRVVERAYAPVAPTPAARAEAEAEVEAFYREARENGYAGDGPDLSRIPAHRPAFSTFVLDDRGHLWVAATAAGRPDGAVWDVFDPGGIYLGRVEAPVDPWPRPRVENGYLAGVRADETGVPVVVLYRIERPGEGAGGA